jgi:hypothetical protein
MDDTRGKNKYGNAIYVDFDEASRSYSPAEIRVWESKPKGQPGNSFHKSPFFLLNYLMKVMPRS